MNVSFKCCAGFTFIELILVTGISCVLILGAVSFVRVQSQIALALHDGTKGVVEFETFVQRLQSSIQQFSVSPQGATIEVQPSRIMMQASAGSHGKNCLGTQVLPHSQIIEIYEFKPPHLRCVSHYFALNGVFKKDTQPVLSGIEKLTFLKPGNAFHPCVQEVQVKAQLKSFLQESAVQTGRFILSCNPIAAEKRG